MLCNRFYLSDFSGLAATERKLFLFTTVALARNELLVISTLLLTHGAAGSDRHDIGVEVGVSTKSLTQFAAFMAPGTQFMA